MKKLYLLIILFISVFTVLLAQKSELVVEEVAEEHPSHIQKINQKIIQDKIDEIQPIWGIIKDDGNEKIILKSDSIKINEIWKSRYLIKYDYSYKKILIDTVIEIRQKVLKKSSVKKKYIWGKIKKHIYKKSHIGLYYKAFESSYHYTKSDLTHARN